MKLVVTGGAGFLGRRLIDLLLAQGALDDGARRQPLHRIRVLDVAGDGLPDDPRIEFIRGGVTDPEAVRAAITPDTGAVVHLAAVVSAEAEIDLDKGLSVNLDGTRRVLEAVRACHAPPRLVFASSVAAFGGDLPPVVDDHVAATPRSSYGAQKVMGELLVSDLSRRGLIDGRCVRIPTVSVRPGPPNRAASGFASGIVREPLAGLDVICPVSAALTLWLSSPRAAAYNLRHALNLPAAQLGGARVINLPGLSVRVSEMVDALGRVGGQAVASRVRFCPDPAIEAVVGGWPGCFRTTRAHTLGFAGDTSFDAVIRQHLAETSPGGDTGSTRSGCARN